jgi:hypothetical protein
MDGIRTALAAVDRVHGDGELPPVPIVSVGGRVYLGGYQSTRGGLALHISLSIRGTHPELTLLHEIGHFLDQQALSGAPAVAFASAWLPEMEEWRQAVTASAAGSALLRLRPTRRNGLTQRQIDYLTSWPEFWARTYAQYIAMRSGEPVLLQQLGRRLAAQKRERVVRLTEQWDRDDFAPIGLAIDSFLLRLQWVVEARS